MSDTSSLSDLARFVGQSALFAEDRGLKAVNEIAGRMLPRVQRRGVGELLGAVLALSARTRRMVLPKAHVDIDVFTPGGERAVRIRLPG